MTSKPKKLTGAQKHLLCLVEEGADPEGWAPVSAQVYPLLEKTLPRELAELEAVGSEGRGRARLTEEGRNVMAASVWLG